MNHASLLRLLALLFSVSMLSCMSLVHRVTFMPDTKTVVPAAALPPDTELVALRTEDNVTIQALKFNRPASDKAVLFFHGNAGNIYGWMSYGERLRRMGFTALLVEYRGYGQSGGKPSEAGVYLDAEAAFAYVHKTLGYASKDIALFGYSLGTAVAVNLAQHKELHGLILAGSVASWGALFDSFLDGMSTFMDEGMFNSIGKARNISCPILIIHGTRDWLAPYEHAEALSRAFPGPKTFVSIRGGHHNDLAYAHRAEFWGAIATFLRRGGAPRP